MKKQLLTAIAALSLIVTVTAAGAIEWGVKLSATVPFAFKLSGMQLPAGKYTIQNGAARQTMILINEETGRSVFSMAQPGASNKNASPCLVFHRYGQQYFLAEVHTGDEKRQNVQTSREERDARDEARIIAARPVQPELITVPLQIGQ